MMQKVRRVFLLLAVVALAVVVVGRAPTVVLAVVAAREGFSKFPVFRLILMQHTRLLLVLVVSHNPRKVNCPAEMVRAPFSSLGRLHYMKRLAAEVAARNVMVLAGSILDLVVVALASMFHRLLIMPVAFVQPARVIMVVLALWARQLVAVAGLAEQVLMVAIMEL